MTNKKVITKRRKSEEVRRESESEYRSLFKNMLDGFAYCRIITDKTNKPVDFIYLEINDAFEKLTGLKRKDVIGKRITKVIPGIKKVHPELFNICGKVALTGKPTKFDIYFKPLDIWLSIGVYSPQKGYFVAVFDNITERKQAEKDLRQSKKKYQQLIEFLHEGIWVIDRDARTTFVNPRMTTMLGYTQEELQGKHLFEFMDEGGIEIAKRYLKRRRRSIKEQHEFEFIRKDGQRIYTLLSVSPITDEQGNYIGAIAGVVDITERRKAEEALRHMAQEWETTFDSIADMISIQDKDYKIIRVNKALADAFKVKPQELIGKICYELLHGCRDPWPTCPHKEVLETKKPARSEFFEPHLGIYLEISASPIFDEKGEVIGTIHIAKDITERKQAEEELRESKKKYYSLIINIPDVIWTTNCKGTTTFISPNVEKVYGYRPAEIYQEGTRLWFGRIHPDDVEKVKEPFEALCEEGVPFDVEYRIKRKDGEWIWLHDRSITTYEKDGVRYADGIFSEITERKRAEEEIKKAREELARRKERRQLAMALHDELAQSMVALTLRTKLIKKQLPHAPEKIKKETDELDQIAKRALQNVRELMADLKTPRLKKLPLMPTIREYIQDFGKKHDLPINIEIKGQPRAVTPHYAFPLFAVIREALYNVARHSRASKVLMKFRFSKKDLKVSIKDNGRGFDLKKWQSAITNHETEGLIIMKERVRKLGGILSIKTAPGKGTRLDILIPLKKESQEKGGRKK